MTCSLPGVARVECLAGKQAASVVSIAEPARQLIPDTEAGPELPAPPDSGGWVGPIGRMQKARLGEDSGERTAFQA